MRKSILFIFFIVTYSASGNINYINIDSIPESERNYDKFIFIKDNEILINHWTPDWNYTINKETLVKELKGCFDAYSKCNKQKPGNFESQLGQVIRSRIQPVKIDSSYTIKDIWSGFSECWFV
ncbi:MAG: hypothetical protein PHY93_19100 [Bacteriovorax sp.]|nr:hypothetical protein [Bacteriovorax sp.]